MFKDFVHIFETCTAWKLSVVGAFLVRIFSHSDQTNGHTNQNSEYGRFLRGDIKYTDPVTWTSFTKQLLWHMIFFSKLKLLLWHIIKKSLSIEIYVKTARLLPSPGVYKTYENVYECLYFITAFQVSWNSRKLQYKCNGRN